MAIEWDDEGGRAEGQRPEGPLSFSRCPYLDPPLPLLPHPALARSLCTILQ